MRITASMRGPMSGQISAHTSRAERPSAHGYFSPSVSSRYAALQKNVRSGPHAIHIANRDVSRIRTAVMRLGGQPASGPTPVAAQSTASRSRPTSPPARSTSAAPWLSTAADEEGSAGCGIGTVRERCERRPVTARILCANPVGATESGAAPAGVQAAPPRVQGMTPPRVELLFWDGCPSHPQALADLRAAMGDLGLDPAAIEVREVDTDQRAGNTRFVGSPTIRIDGEDVDPPPDGEPFGLTCRVYRLRDGRYSPVPDPAVLREALENAMTRSTT